MKSAVASRVEKHRASLRHKGLKPVQIWVPDVRSKGFAEECKRQAMLVKCSEGEQEINAFIENFVGILNFLHVLYFCIRRNDQELGIIDAKELTLGALIVFKKLVKGI